MSNYFGYMRISTKEERGLQKFNRQDKAIEKFAADNNISEVLVKREAGVSPARTRRCNRGVWF